MNILVAGSTTKIIPIITQSGHHLVLAHNHQETLACYAAARFDLVLLDDELPDSNILDIISKIQSQHKDRISPFLVLVSDSAESSHLTNIIATVGDNFLIKPTNPLLLNAKLEAIKHTIQMQQQIAAQNENEQAAEHTLKLHIKQQQFIIKLNRLALVESSLDVILNAASVDLVKILDVNVCKILRLSKDRQHFILKAGTGFDSQLINQFRPTNIKQSLLNTALDTTDPISFRNIEKDTLFTDVTPPYGQSINSGIIAAINGTKTNWGVMTIHTDRPKIFTVEELKFIHTVASSLSEIIIRKQFELTLQTSENKFLQLANNIDEMLWISSADGSEVLYVSPAYEKITGRKVEEFYNDPLLWIEDIHPEDRACTIDAFILMTTQAIPFCNTVRICRPDGSIRTITDKGFPTFDQHGDLKTIVGIVRDITEQRQLEVQIQSRTEYLSSVMTNLVDGLIIIDNRGLIQSINPAVVNLFGYPANEIVGNNIKMLMPKPYHSEHRSYLKRYRKTGIKNITDNKGKTLTGQRKDGSTFPLDLVVSEISTKNEHHFIGTIRDTSEQQQLEDQIKSRTEYLSALVTNLVDGLIIIDNRGLIQSVNPAVVNLFGYPASEIVGNNIKMLMPKPYHSEHRSYLKRYRKTGIKSITDNKGKTLTGQRKDGSTFPLDLVVSEISTKNEHHFIGTIRDISEQKKMEMELQMAQKLEAVGQLAAGIAHEINTPAQYTGDNIRFINDSFDNIVQLLSKFTGLLEAQKNGSVADEQISQLNTSIEDADLEYLLEEIPLALSQSQEGIESISQIVLAMKEFSHPGSDNKDLADINHIIENTVTVTKNEWKYVAETTLNLAPNLPSVPCYAQKIGQALMNLIINAAHAISDVIDSENDELGNITINTILIEDYIRITIEDTGSGIPQDIIDKIFDPFFTSKGVGKGTGQGLAITRAEIVNKHQGHLSCESVLKKGTTFTIELPLTPSKIEATEATL